MVRVHYIQEGEVTYETWQEWDFLLLLGLAGAHNHVSTSLCGVGSGQLQPFFLKYIDITPYARNLNQAS